jgi:hypothetical protein
MTNKNAVNPLSTRSDKIDEGKGKGKEREYTPSVGGGSDTPDKKRVLPSRSSRRNVHALGLGHSAIDLLILNSQQTAGAFSSVSS